MDKVFTMLISLAALGSCSKGSDAIVVDTSFDMLIKNDAGLDLLDPATSGSFSEGDINLYYRVDNQKVRYFKSNLDAPKGFKLLKNEALSRYYLRVFPDGPVKDQESMLYLEFKCVDLDSIRTFNIVSGSSKVCTKIWYNDKQVWDMGTASGGRYFEVLK
jgi:hypothetical protein